MKQYLIISLFILALSISSTGQNAVISAGGDLNNGNGSISFSIGQIIISSPIGNNGSVSHGVQQPYEISEITGIYANNDVNIDIAIYPNPAIDELHIEFTDRLLATNKTFFQIFDSKGNLFKSQKVNDTKSALKMEALASGTYILRIIQIPESLSPKIIKAFKIIKK